MDDDDKYIDATKISYTFSAREMQLTVAVSRSARRAYIFLLFVEKTSFSFGCPSKCPPM
jgi:hypothetical protein